MNSAAARVTIAALTIPLRHRPLLRGAILASGLAFTLLAGFSRIYFGVHWPSDVLAGWSTGAGWAAICALAYQAGLPSAADAERQRLGGPTTS